MPNPDAPVASAQELSSNTAEEEMTATDDDVNSLLAIDESVSEEPGQVTTNFKNCKVYHYTKATISNDGWNQIKNLFDDSGVNASTTIYSVDIANLVLTETRAQSFVDDDTSELHELCSNIFDEKKTEWYIHLGVCILIREVISMFGESFLVLSNFPSTTTCIYE